MKNKLQKENKNIQTIENIDSKMALRINKKALANIIEDINEGQSKLKKKYNELEIVKNLAQDLGLSMELYSVIHSVSQSMQEIFPEVTIAYCLAPLSSDYLANKISVFSELPLSSDYLKNIEKNILKGLKKNIKTPGARKNLNALKDTKFSFKVLEKNKLFELDIEKNKLVSSLNVPVIVAGTIVGMINFSFDQKFFFYDRDKNIINTVINNTAKTIERLRALACHENDCLNNLVKSMNNGVLMFDLHKKITVINPIAKELLKNTANDEYNNLSLDDLLTLFERVKKTAEQTHIENKTNINREISNALNEDKTIHFKEVQIKNRIFEISIAPVKNYKKEITGGILVLYDITHLQAINQMEDEFASVASNKLQTPLTSIRLFMEMLARGDIGKLNKDQKKYVNDMCKSTRSMIHLVNELLNLPQIESGKFDMALKLVKMEELIQKIIDKASKTANKNKCKIIFKKPKKPLKTTTDPSLLGQVIHSLITNAIHYSPIEPCSINIALRKKGDKYYVISVEDKGIGIPIKMQNKIFEKFFRANNAKKVLTSGSGLGLYVSKIIVEKLGGEIWLRSQEGKGTTFYVSIPA